MKANKYILITIVTGLAVLFTGCEGKLDIQQNGAITIGEFYQTDEDCEEAMTAAYSQLRTMCTTAADCPWYLKTLLSDETYAGGDGARGNMAMQEQLNEYQFDPRNSYISSVYMALYKLVYMANLVVNYTDPSESDIKGRNYAEALVLRAYAYIDLVSMWGDVPLVTQAVRDNYKVTNTPAEQVWEQIETDLKKAIEMGTLTKKSSLDDGKATIRVTEHYAYALLGKAYVYQGKYDDAIEWLEKVINSGLYDFLNDDYGAYVDAANNYNREVLFSDNVPYDVNNTKGSLQVTHNVYGLANSASLGIYSTSWGALTPSLESIEAFIAMEGTSGYRFTTSIKSYDQFVAMGSGLSNPTQRMYANCGYWNWKLRAPLESEVKGASSASFYNNDIVMRYAEVVLLAAEAHIMASSGNPGMADSYLNMIRTKAQLTGKSGVTLQDVIEEKRLELYVEGTRYQDILRWGIGSQIMADQGSRIPFFGFDEDGVLGVEWIVFNNTYGFKERHRYLPFPEEEVNINPGFEQNTGW